MLTYSDLLQILRVLKRFTLNYGCFTFDSVIDSKVASTHLWNKTLILYQRLYVGMPFIVGERGIGERGVCSNFLGLIESIKFVEISK